MLCQEYCLVKRIHPGLTIIPLRCKCWDCPECRPRRKARLVHEAKAGQATKFITLTSRNTPGGCPDAAARALVRAWRRVRAEYIKEHGKGSLPFLAVFEATLKGWPHLHIVARASWVSQKWLSKRMGELIDSPVVGVEAIRDKARMAYYISKYMGKNPHRFAGVKRYWRSLDFLLPSEEPEEPAASIGRWERIDCTWRQMVEYLNLRNFKTTHLGRDMATVEYWYPP